MRFYVLMIFLLLAGCSTLDGTFVQKKGVNASVPTLIKAFDRATTGLRGRSANGRDIVSRYQKPGATTSDNAVNDAKRAYSRLIILGDRRPYTLQVQHIVEKRTSSGTYDVVQYDDRMARETLKRVLDFLVHRPDKEGFIDDFKAF